MGDMLTLDNFAADQQQGCDERHLLRLDIFEQ